MLIDMLVSLTGVPILMAMSSTTMLVWAAVRKVVVRVLTVDDMGGDVMVHNMRDDLYTDYSSEEAANDCIRGSWRR